jgi:sigma-E factor negative regulatory protein RseB
MARRWASSLLVLLAALAGLPVVTAGEGESAEVQKWLDRMALAIDELNYEGTLAYTRGNQIDALRIFHSVTESGSRERLVSLTGTPREVLRDNDTVRCIFPDSQSVLIDTRITERLFPSIPPEQVANAGARYRFSLGGRGRIAQLDALIINIQPLDDLRYGYRLWLETNTGMLLKSSLLDTDGQPLEQLMFTEIRIGGRIADSDLIPDVPDGGYVQVEFPKSVAEPGIKPEAGHWQVENLPAGFMLTGHRHSGAKNNGQMEHLIFTDGLASVSVYVEVDAGEEAPLSGVTRIGAVSMFGIRIDGHTVTAVGEVPAETLRQMASSVQPAGLASR